MDGERTQSAAPPAASASDASALSPDSKASTNLAVFGDYLLGKVVPTTIVYTTIGMSTTYLRGESLPLSFYRFSSSGTIMASLYFGTAYAVRVGREVGQDDIINHAVAGGVVGGLLAGAKAGVKKGAIGGLLGTVAAAATYTVASYLYAGTRSMWVESRKHTLHHSVERVIFSRSPNFNSPRTEVDLSRGTILVPPLRPFKNTSPPPPLPPLPTPAGSPEKDGGSA